MHLAVLCDVAPTPSNTLLQTEGVFDAHKIYGVKKEAADKSPGKPAVITNSLRQAAQERILNTTLTLDMQFKKD